MGLKLLKTVFCWFSRGFLGVSFVFFCTFGVIESFCGFVKIFGKPKNNIKKNKPISKGGSDTFKNFVWLVFPKVVCGFFGFLLGFWFSKACGFLKTFGGTKQTTKTNPYPRVGLKPLKTCFFVYSLYLFVFFGFLWYCWFSRRFFWFCKNLRENKQTKKTNPYPRVGLKPVKTVCFVVFPKVVCGFLVFSFVFLIFSKVFWFSKNLRGNQQQQKKHIQGWV